MSGIVYLLAGNPFVRGGKPDPAMRAFFKELDSSLPRVAYIGAASGDDRAFFESMRVRLQASGAGEVELAPLCGKAGGVGAAACRVLERADAVFVSGGDVAEGMDVLRARDGVIACLRKRFEAGVPFMGLSAGSIMLARGWVRWADEENSSSDTLFDCLGFAPLYCDVHDEGGGWGELRALLDLLPEPTAGYAIRAGEAIRVENGVVTCAPSV